MFDDHLIHFSPYFVTFILCLGGKIYYIAVGNTGLIYLSIDGGAKWVSPKTVDGYLAGAITTHTTPYYFLSLTLISLFLQQPSLGLAIDRAGNAFAVGSGNFGSARTKSTVFYSPLSSAYATWTSISPPGKFRYKTHRHDIRD